MRILLSYIALYKKHQWMLILGIMLAIITTLASTIAITLSGWFISASAVAGVAGLYSFNYMLPAAGIRGITIIRTVGRYFERLVSHNATFCVLQCLRIFVFSRLMPLSPAGLACFRHGEILNRLVADVDALDHLYLRIISPLVSAFVMIIVITLSLSMLDMTLALVLGSIMLLTLFLMPLIFYHLSKAPGEKITKLRSEYRQQLTSWLHGQAEITLFGASQLYRTRLDAIEFNLNKLQYKQSKLNALSQSSMMLISSIVLIAMLWLTANGIGNNYQPGALISLFVFCALTIFDVLAPVTIAFQHLGHVIASAMRITDLVKKSPEVKFIIKNTQIPKYVALSFKNVTFKYNTQLRPVLNDLTLDISAGEYVAILGRTGCGKSTLLQLLTRAWDPCKGFISINNVPLTDFSEQALRHTIGMVTQRVHLFSATLRDNLLLAAPNTQDTQLNTVIEQVGLQKLLEGNGLGTWLGEGGRQLSGGELRRLAVARVILHNSPLILLDEPTEGLDAATENQILDLIKQIMKDKTIMMVTHRLYGLVNCDRIIIMDNGRIVEQGNHKELLKRQGFYYKLKQF